MKANTVKRIVRGGMEVRGMNRNKFCAMTRFA